MAQVQLSKWGNSLGLRVPRDLAARLGLSEGARVDVEARGDALVVTKSTRRFTLDELLADMTPERQHKAEDDPPRGAEIL